MGIFIPIVKPRTPPKSKPVPKLIRLNFRLDENEDF